MFADSGASEANEDGKSFSIPEMRGMKPTPKNRTRKYSAASYAAQYGITVEDAEDLVNRCNDHRAVEQAIHRMLSLDPELRQKALMLDGEVEMNEEEKARYERLAQRIMRGEAR